ncbi:hypothetical protein P8C59_006442 [Phyllachora maydis]|uniref:Uncharacterized protein n=1 Tax=Phyllachora maydis TaxID=1825666 RepID=A0AAD9I7P2_9PEZI|nr:hypothetical protein P8C59_006442 [Phyllachora maydis]
MLVRSVISNLLVTTSTANTTTIVIATTTAIIITTTTATDLGQSSRPLLLIQTLLEDKKDGEDYSEVIEVLKHTIDLDSPLRPPRKKLYLGPAVNSATSNLDPPIDTESKEGFKDTITSSIVKELSKKAYTIPDDTILLMLLYNSLSSSPRAAISWIYIPSKAFKLLVRQYSRPIESEKEDVYNEFHALTLSTYKKGLLAFNAEFNGYLAKLTIAEIDIDPSLILNYLNIEYLMADILEESRNLAIDAYGAAYIANSSNSTPNSNSNPSKKGKNKKKGSYNLAIEEEEESDSAFKGYKKRKDFKGKGLKTSSNKAKYKDNQLRRRPRDPALYNKVLSRKASPPYTKLVLDNVLYLPNIKINIISRIRHYDSGGCLVKETLSRGNGRCIAILDFKKSGFFLDVKGSSKPILYANFAFPLGLTSYNTTQSIEPQRNKIVVEMPSNSIRKEDYRPIIEDAIVSEAIEPKKRCKLRNSPAKGTTLEGVGPSLRGKRPYRPIEPLANT